MTARRWWLAGIGTVAFAAIAVVLCVWLLPDRSDSDCPTVRQLIEFNQRHNEALAANSDPDEETPLSDYEAWAAQVGSYAIKITDPQLAPHAKAVADLASQTITVVKESRDEAVQAPEPGPPPSAQKYAQVAVQFRDEINALNKACPV
ncbi:MAG: hypothetical protein QOK02_148 [Mycobacterium sp.]|jgi:hypothetical protein|nr:hypothetical protein [Mycobacterium sp.]